MKGKEITVGEASAAILGPLTEVTTVLNAKGVVIGYFEPACLFEKPESLAPPVVDSPDTGDSQGSWRDRGSLL